MREALRLVYEEGLEERFPPPPGGGGGSPSRPSGNGTEAVCPRRPPGAHADHRAYTGRDRRSQVRRRLLDEYSVEIGGGLGEMKGRLWRIGLMGHSCQRRNVALFLAALQRILQEEGFRG